MHYFSDGYNPTKLDVVYSAENAKFYRGTKNEYIPAWSLTALLEIMPQHIDSRLGWRKFGLDKGWDGGIYQVFYENKNSFIEKKEKEVIDAAFEMVCWLLENGYIKKSKK